jgi:hypothetical protein
MNKNPPSSLECFGHRSSRNKKPQLLITNKSMSFDTFYCSRHPIYFLRDYELLHRLWVVTTGVVVAGHGAKSKDILDWFHCGSLPAFVYESVL